MVGVLFFAEFGQSAARAGGTGERQAGEQHQPKNVEESDKHMAKRTAPVGQDKSKSRDRCTRGEQVAMNYVDDMILGVLEDNVARMRGELKAKEKASKNNAKNADGELSMAVAGSRCAEGKVRGNHGEEGDDTYSQPSKRPESPRIHERLDFIKEYQEVEDSNSKSSNHGQGNAAEGRHGQERRQSCRRRSTAAESCWSGEERDYSE